MALNNDKKNKNKPSDFNVKAYKHAISMIESDGGNLLDNPNSSAAGKYHFLYSLIKDDPSMDGVSKREFMNRPELQDNIMDKALNGTLKGFTYGTNYAKKLKQEYKTDHNVNDLTALVHFLGAGNVRKYLKDPLNFKVPGKKNATAQQYIERFRKHFDTFEDTDGSDDTNKSYPTPPKPVESIVDNEGASALKVKDGINVGTKEFIPLKQQSQPQPQSQQSGLKFLTEMAEPNEFAQGGPIKAESGANELVTIFEGGGTHQENPLGGIPQGIGANGKQNLVEEGETKWNDYIFSNSISINGVFTDSNGGQSNVFDKGGKATKKKEVVRSSIGTSLLRNALPLPQNASQLGASMLTGDSKYSTKDSNNNVNEHLYRSVRNAIKRNKGKDGGTEYEDYSADVAKDLNGLSMKSPEMIAASALSPELTAATTFGRVSYKTNPETGDVEIYDSYDFNKTGNIGGAYGKIRKLAGDASQGRLDSKPKLIGRFNDKTGKSWGDKLNNFVEDVSNPIDAMDIEYSTIKNAAKIPNQIGDAIYDTGVSAYNTGKKWINQASNYFETGGDLSSKKNVSPSPLKSIVFGDAPAESKKYPIKLEKRLSINHAPGTGQKLEINDIRSKYQGSQVPQSIQPISPDDKVNFDRATTDSQSKSFLDRYNDPATREMMKGQSNVTDYDIDNMILRGLEASKTTGGNNAGSKASYSKDNHAISMGDEFKDDKNVETHERVHASGFDAVQGDLLLKTLGDSRLQEGRSFLKSTSPGTLKYLNQPHEAYGNFVEFREKIGLKPGEKIDEKELARRVKESGAEMENFYRAFNDKNIVKALNTIAYQNNSEAEYKLA